MLKPSMRIGDLGTLWKLARRRLRSEEDYRAFQSFQSALLSEYLERFGTEFAGQRILDLGSGIGGYSLDMAKRGAKVLSLDLVQPARALRSDATVLVADALAIPFGQESIDLVFCASLIEHIRRPERLLAEIQRVLTMGGTCYLSFPPFFSPLGGHEFSPWHYLGEGWALRLSRGRRRFPAWVGAVYEVPTSPRSLSESFQTWGLFKMTIARAKHLIAAAGFETIDMSTRYLPLSAVRWPILGEVLTWHVQFLLKKPCSSDVPD
jgi:ubiquinone/menaquinone biosynthesis C-methylase UbiE